MASDDRWEVVADLVTEEGKGVSVTSSPTSREVAGSLADDLKEGLDVRAFFIHKAEGDDA